MRLLINIWQESEGMPWFWEIFDEEDANESILKSGISLTNPKAISAANRAYGKLLLKHKEEMIRLASVQAAIAMAKGGQPS